jgi:uncharacterized protein (DUF934 family)
MSEAAHLLRLTPEGPQAGGTPWRVLGLAGAAEAESQADLARALLPLPRALELLAAGAFPPGAGVWLAPADDPLAAAPLLPHVAAVGVQFPKFTDGRGYSSATLVRTRLGWMGELHAFGDVLQDQLFAMRRVGFDSFALRADRDPQAALRAFATFSSSYQGSVSSARPHFSRGDSDLPA